MSDIGTAYVNIVPKSEGFKGVLTKQLGSEGSSAGTAAGTGIVSKLKGIIAGAAIGTTVVMGIKKAIGEGAALQQSMGGIETLFKDSADTVIKNAKRAYETAGMSANQYMENVTSFSASLIKSLDGDTVQAAKSADMAIVDMSDNANKMGTSIESIQNAYQGFAKQNYTMLDNLKLGYGGTKEEMQRLLDDAGKISGQEYDMSNLNDVYEAIHVIQGELDITGTTAEEASKTISGSFNSMKAAFTDFMGNLALGQDVGPAMKNLVDAAVTFLVGNLLPAIVNIMKSLPQAIGAGIQAVASYIPQNLLEVMAQAMDTFTMMLPFWLEKGVQLVTNIGNGIIAKIPDVLNNMATLITMLVNFIAANYPKIVAAGIKLISGLVKGFIAHLPQILAALGRVILAIGRGLLKLLPLGLNAGMQMLKAIASGIGSAIGVVLGKVKGFVDRIIAPFRSMAEKIKGFFKFNVSLPHVKLPHFSISPAGWKIGDLIKGEIPHLSIKWYAKGGIATQPVLGLGEAGPEAILPLDPFWKRLDKVTNGNNDITINVYGAEGQSPKAIALEVKDILIRETKQRRLAW